MANVAKLVLQQPNDKLIKLLAQESDILERQRRSFASISNSIAIACISEELPTGIGLVRLQIMAPTVLTCGQIVPEFSASIDGFSVKTSSVPANHMGMSKFADQSDIGYKRVSGHIISFIRQAARGLAEGKSLTQFEINTPKQPAPRLLLEPSVGQSLNFASGAMSAETQAGTNFGVEEVRSLRPESYWQ